MNKKIKPAVPPNKGIKLEEDEENKILEVEAEEKEVFQAKEIFPVTLTQCIICKKPGHDSKNCYFRCTKCKIPNHSQRDYWYKDDKSAKEKHDANFTKEVENAQVFFSCMSVQ